MKKPSVQCTVVTLSVGVTSPTKTAPMPSTADTHPSVKTVAVTLNGENISSSEVSFVASTGDVVSSVKSLSVTSAGDFISVSKSVFVTSTGNVPSSSNSQSVTSSGDFSYQSVKSAGDLSSPRNPQYVAPASALPPRTDVVYATSTADIPSTTKSLTITSTVNFPPPTKTVSMTPVGGANIEIERSSEQAVNIKLRLAPSEVDATTESNRDKPLVSKHIEQSEVLKPAAANIGRSETPASVSSVIEPGVVPVSRLLPIGITSVTMTQEPTTKLSMVGNAPVVSITFTTSSPLTKDNSAKPGKDDADNSKDTRVEQQPSSLSATDSYL